ncbi:MULTISPECIES: CusA/CzcA family heavy metal efflux RND transporter [Cyanophyceae]|uniref:CusA/CzcA family heavy metal efflux RND transporter n=1 Tax=Cyanophyceae TaxID=3028117 RepID=UPI0002A67755|nr:MULTISPECIES: CusA/CzcA family heavy metal efflux RND transporter [Cyanophyceae]AFZ33471.1 heavy metal efflux pump, CzcA family [Gloeocapsa sp. PCC 7428]PPS41981.1 CusA/CzcA family heavy metal efflux RND transporter [Chroococcidiopsis sp. TS-821]
MFNSILNQTLKNSIAQRWFIVVCAILVTVWGVFSATQMPLDVFPEFAPPQVDIHTEATGLAPEEVESQITVPIESAVNGLPGVTTVRSSSKVGLSMVQVVFDQDADIYQARQAVTERLQQVTNQLPEGVHSPEISPLASPLGTILQYAFTVNGQGKTSLMDLRRLVDSTLSNQILSVPGVTDVTIYGGDERQEQVLVDPEKLRSRNVSLTEVTNAARGANSNAPGGFLIGGGQELLVRGIGQVKSIADLQESVVKVQDSKPVFLKDVAVVKTGAALKRGDASFNGQPAVVLMINKQPDVDTPTVTKAVEAVMQSLQPNFPPDVQIAQTFRQSNFIDSAIGNVSGSLIEGIIIVSVIMLLFLMNWRTAVITLSAIPLSLLIGLMFMKAFGLGINTMTLGGLVVAIGSVVDDSIVDMENCYRGLRTNQAQGNPKHPFQVVYDTSVEVRLAVIFSTVIIVVVFAPIFSLTGVEGRIFAPMGLAYLLSIAASTLVAMTLSPALCAILLANQTLPQQGTFISRWAERLYRPLLNLSLRSPQIILGLALAALVAAFAIIPSLGRVFLPEFQEKSMVNSMVLFPGVSLDMTNRAGTALSNSLKDNPLYEWVQVRAGRTPGDADGAGVNMAHVDVELSDLAMQDREASVKQLREAFLKLPGVAPNIGGFISHRMDEVLSGVRSAIAVKIFGPDLTELRRIGEQVRDIIQPIGGVVDLQLEPQLPIRQVQIQYNRAAAATYGLSMEQLSGVVETALNGRVVSQVAENQQLIDISVALAENARNNLDAIRAIPLFTPTGQTISLSTVATVDYGMGANVVNREDVSRLIVVSANVAERDLGSVVSDIQAQIRQKVQLPNGYFIQYGGQFESEQRASNNLLVFSILAAIAIAVLMFFSVKSLSATIAIMINLPLALVGGIVSIALTGGVISIASLIGFITLFGVAVRNGLLLVDNYNNKFAQGMHLQDVIVNGSLERVNAILMTALTSALGMLPLAIASGAGNEILQPLAIVVLGGLFTSTALTLLVIPAVYAKFGKRLMPKQKSVAVETSFPVNAEPQPSASSVL